MADDAKLKAIAISFSIPKDKDGKDDNTLLTCVVKRGAVLIAILRDFAGTDEFKSGPDSKYYDLEIQTHVTKAVYLGSSTTLTFKPQGGAGHDTAFMIATLTAKFDDDEVLITDSGEQKYENASEKNWVNQ